ncbi:hypothetical protein B0T21DRAFT_44879 [Apiosordaria backusii]|uniref:Zn(2)-C6 fungal-type domain-containing protein n=1 Tax=Apiosordaria backusii TaxID=314023 RepID=A0AA40AXN0_9PEZI|nr:hypothetical protein B0T21DRAFT_44879 [Apiosordaria backusii]
MDVEMQGVGAIDAASSNFKMDMSPPPSVIIIAAAAHRLQQEQQQQRELEELEQQQLEQQQLEQQQYYQQQHPQQHPLYQQQQQQQQQDPQHHHHHLQQPPQHTQLPVVPGPPQQQLPQVPPPADPPAKRRAPIACRRCRRLRSKCNQTDKGKPPCQACTVAGLGPEDCVFPVRGQPDEDREYRHPRTRADKNGKRDKSRKDQTDQQQQQQLSANATAISSPGGKLSARSPENWGALPPLEDILDAVNNFTRHYFQLGFIPKQRFIQKLRVNHRSVSLFLLLGILSVSARLTPSLVERYGSAVNAAEIFMEHASTAAVAELYREPSLERCQAFYLLSIAQQGSALTHRSSVNMAIAMRMATLLKLHREETYVLVNPTKELVIQAESARRTLWMLHSQDNLHSGPRSPVLLAASDITALLPCDEKDFAAAREPKSRAALEDTQPALEKPELIADPGRSLFASLIQAHYYWGGISRRAISHDKSARPWEPTSQYAKLERRLAEWEASLPNDHRWSTLLLKGYKQEGHDLAYLGVTMTPRLCNIVLRKAYIHDMINHDTSNAALVHFWGDMAQELFRNVKELYEQIQIQYGDRAPDEGPGAQMAVGTTFFAVARGYANQSQAFCVYTCGFLTCYLCKYPKLCLDPMLVRNAPHIVQHILGILDESKHIWPLAARWYDHLEKFSRMKTVMAAESQGGMADSVSAPSSNITQPHPTSSTSPPPSSSSGDLASSIQREPIPHVLEPALKDVFTPIQPRLLPSPTTSNEGNKNHSGAVSPSLSALSSGGPGSAILPLPQGLPPPANSHQLYIDPSLRLPLPNGPPPHTPQQQQQVISPPQQHAQLSPIGGGRQSTDGLGLLLEAFDHRSAAGPPGPGLHDPHGAEGQGQGPPAGAPYDPRTAPQSYYPYHGLPMNDGYENELGYYMSDGVPSTMQNWVGTPHMYTGY